MNQTIIPSKHNAFDGVGTNGKVDGEIREGNAVPSKSSDEPGKGIGGNSVPSPNTEEPAKASVHVEGPSPAPVMETANDKSQRTDSNTTPPAEEEAPSSAAVHPRDIRFGDLPNPRDLEQHDSTSLGGILTLVSLREHAVDAEEAGGGRRSITFERPSEDPRYNSFFRRHSTFNRPATFERILSNAFQRRRRDESPNSRQSATSNTTLPYFTFTPTIGRNSVSQTRMTISW
jgi:hypothetical protein